MNNETKTRVDIGEMRRWIKLAHRQFQWLPKGDVARFNQHLELWMQSEQVPAPTLRGELVERLLHWMHWAQTHLDNLKERDERFLRAHLALWKGEA